MNKPVIIGICGGTGSGKTTVAREILSALPQKNVSIIHQDAYYKLQSNKSFDERTETNYDHPFAFDTELLLTHLENLQKGTDIDMPIYDFSNHNRCDETTRFFLEKLLY